jgi:hypothetical protein
MMPPTMMAKRVITDPEAARNLSKRLVDPRSIVQIILVATEDQPAISGFPTPQTLPISAFAAANPACHAILKELPEPQIRSGVVKGSGIAALSEGAATGAFNEMATMPRNATTYLQIKTIPTYKEGRSGPTEFALLTICRDESAARSDVVFVRDGELVPSHDATGAPLVEIKVDAPDPPALTAHLERNEQLWDTWMSLGVTEQRAIRVDFEFHATNRSAADELQKDLEQLGLSVALAPTRTLFIFKGWRITGSENARWTRERLQSQTRVLFDLARKHDVTLQSIGAAISTS